MPWSWLWVLILGGVVLVGGVVGARMLGGGERAESRPSGPGLLIGGSLTAVAFVLCLPSRFPFSPGANLGYGALLGLGATVLAMTALWLGRPSRHIASRTAAHCSAAGAAVVWVAVTELAFRGDPGYALLGGIGGALLTLAPVLWRGGDSEDSGPWFYGIGLLVLGLGSLLSIERYSSVALRPYWVLPSIAYGAGLLGALIGALILGRSRAARWSIGALAVIATGALWFAISHLVRSRAGLAIEFRTSALLGLGWAIFVVAGAAAPSAGERLFGRIAIPLLGVILLVTGFNLGGASGASIALAAGLPLSLAFAGGAGRAAKADTGLWLGALGALYLVYRLYLARYGGGFRADETLEFGRHYVFVGLAAGLLWATAAREARSGIGAALAEAVAVPVLPVALYIVFGYPVLLGLILGLWAEHLLALAGRERAWRSVPSAVVPLLAVWALIIPGWAFFMLDQARWVRGLVIGVVVFAVLVLLGLLRRRANDEPAAAGTPLE